MSPADKAKEILFEMHRYAIDSDDKFYSKRLGLICVEQVLQSMHGLTNGLRDWIEFWEATGKEFNPHYETASSNTIWFHFNNDTPLKRSERIMQWVYMNVNDEDGKIVASQVISRFIVDEVIANLNTIISDESVIRKKYWAEVRNGIDQFNNLS